MREGTDLRETILREAEQLFMAHGYAGTSIKQIAVASGCTTAALYYYFPEGKAQILREVVRSSFSLKATMLMEAGQDATSLPEWLRAFGSAATQTFHDLYRRNSWIELELHQLGADERDLLHRQGRAMHQTIAKEIARFVEDKALADKLAWLLICTFFGYGQLFLGQELNRAVEFAPALFVETLAWLVEKAID